MNYNFKLRKIFTRIMLLLFLISNISLQSQTFYWQKLAGFDDFETYDILSDGEQNLYIAGVKISTPKFYRSSDLGITWTTLASPKLFHLALDSSGTIWGGNFSGGLYKTTNNGDNWQLSAGYNIFSLAVSNNNWIWAGTSSGIIVHSSNNGTTWEEDIVGTDAIWSLAFNSQNHIFAGEEGRIYRSTNSGVSWELIYSNPAIYTIQGIVVNDSGHIYADGYSKTIVSKDNGITWTILPRPEMHNLYKDKYNNFYGFGYRSSDNCINWTYIGPVTEFVIGTFGFVDSLIFAGVFEGVFLYDPTYQPYTGTNNYPLSIGNKWQYNETSGSYNSNSFYYVDRDTILSGKRYFLLKGDVNDWVRYDSVKNVLYLRWNDSDHVIMDFELNAGSAFSSIMFNSHFIYPVTAANDFYLSIFDSSYFTKGHIWQYYTLGWTKDTTYYSEGLGETKMIHSADGRIGDYSERTLIRAVINNPSGTTYYTDHVKPEIIFQPWYVTNTFSINWNFMVDHDYSFVSTFTDNNFVDSVIIFSYYSNEQTTFMNEPLAASGTPHTINYNLSFRLDSTLMTNGFAFYYKIYAVDKGIVPEHSTKPDTGYYKLIYDSTFVTVEADEKTITEYSLQQNYPNPFNPTTTISYSLPAYSSVSIKIFNTLGQQIAILVNEEKPAGRYEVVWNAEGLPSGVYIYHLSAGSFTDSKKMILMR